MERCISNSDTTPWVTNMNHQPDLTFAVMTDLHLGWSAYSDAKVDAAVNDLLGLDFDLLVILGDIVDMREDYWTLFHTIIRERMDRPMIFVRGNADFDAGGDEAWERNIGQPLRYSLSSRGVHLTLVGAQGGDHVLPVGEGAADWLDRDLAAHQDELSVVLLHAPLKDTTFWSCSNTEDGCLARYLGPSVAPFNLFCEESEALGQVLRRHPHVQLVLSGHCHNDNRMSCDHGYGPLRIADGIPYLTTANLGGWEGIGRERREIRWVRVSSEGIRVRTRDVILQRWVDPLEFSLPLRPATVGSF